ncbi:iron transporter FeoA [[Bacillus] enclensis]|uniref:Ferrous iron transport protein A n=2 Tax=[Bacillus] enclensis TaxID=1402860 RepID=A0A0V8HJK9_9BACI|nr:FeoA family protein [[Bacillus] enclensis]KSU62742.1 iron transporter FeoA [[Bacillus] enclensis]MBH9965214.1 ferrous iron transport protein A [[Bacillus] enclensis]SCC08840.1 ferrous iron transport protein A [[Bacillus] enclensis]
MSAHKYKLCQLQEGMSVQIISMDLTGVMRRRLLDLGFVPGNVVTVVNKSPLGDPIAFRVSGTVIALRKEESSNIYGEMV